MWWRGPFRAADAGLKAPRYVNRNISTDFTAEAGRYRNGFHRGPEWPAAHVRIYLALLPSGPDAVRRLKLHRFRTAMQSANRECTTFPTTPLPSPETDTSRALRR